MPATPTRAHPRVSLRRRCWCESGSVTIYAQIGNVSEGGLFVKTFAPLGEGTRARVRWGFDDGDAEIEAEAVVVWCRDAGDEGEPSGMGLRFEQIDPTARQSIREFVSRAAGL